jgi:hypothetical protein
MSASTLSLPSFGLSAADAAFYQEHGWVTTGTVIEEAWIEETLAGLQEHWSGHRDHTIPGANKHFADWMPGAGEGTRNNEYISLQNEKISRLAWSPAIGAIAASAAGSAEIRLYWGTCSSWNMLTAWVPLHDCPEEMGPLVVLDGSHKWSHKVDRSILSFHSPDMEALQRHVEELGFAFKPVTMELKRGQFSLHHCRAIHGSYPNRSDRPRIALAVHLQDGANAYRPANRPDGRPVQLYNDMICTKTADGVPDYKDNAVFPVLWSESRAAESSKGSAC